MKHAFKVVREDDKVPFNLGTVVESLQSVGLPTDEAVKLARTLEKHYRQKGSKEVGLGALQKTLLEELSETHGRAVAARLAAQPPPFAPLKVRGQGAEDSSVEPFSRRKLATFIENHGYSFKDANTLARQVEQELRRSGAHVVTPPEVTRQSALVIGAQYGREAQNRFEVSQGQPSELWIVRDDGERVPYSRGILAQSLLALGLSPDLSYRLANRVGQLLWRFGRRDVPLTLLRRSVKRLLLQEAGEDFVRRYELLHTLRHPEQPLVILIGGAPGVGKSNLASALAYRLGVSRIVSTDAIRQALRSLITPELSPELHSSSFTAWRAELLPTETPKPGRKRVVRGFQRQVRQLTAPLEAIIQRSAEEASSLILEGIHLIPGFIPLDELSDVTVVEMVLSVSDPELHKGYFGTREVQTRSRRRREHYLTHFDEIRILQDFCVEQAKSNGVPTIEASNMDALVEHAIEHILNAALSERSEPFDQELEALTRELAESGV